MPPIYTKALIIGATSGIGEALASKLFATGTSVIVTGRRQDRLDAFVQRHQGDDSNSSNKATATALPLDIDDLAALPAFASRVTSEHPDLDCVIVNAGIQRAINFSSPGTAAPDLAAFDAELRTNYTAPVHLTAAFLPHLQSLASRDEGAPVPTTLVYISASLGLVPTLIRTPGYNASKAALHSFLTTLRAQLRDPDTAAAPGPSLVPAGAPANPVRVVEVFPPAVQTELHDAKHQPDLKDGGKLGMPLDAFTERCLEGLARARDAPLEGEGAREGERFAVGPAEAWFRAAGDGGGSQVAGFEVQREGIFDVGGKAVREALAKFAAQ